MILDIVIGDCNYYNYYKLRIDPVISDPFFYKQFNMKYQLLYTRNADLGLESDLVKWESPKDVCQLWQNQPKSPKIRRGEEKSSSPLAMWWLRLLNVLPQSYRIDTR